MIALIAVAPGLVAQDGQRCASAEFNLGFQHAPSEGETHQSDVLFDNVTDFVTVGVAPGETGVAKVWAAIISRVGGVTDTHGGVQGWAIQARLTGDLSIVDATAAGTAAAPAPDGVYSGGFTQTRIPNLREESGFYSAVVLSFTDSVTLAPLGTATVLEVTLETREPASESTLPATGRLAWVDGCTGCATPFVIGATARDRPRSFCSKENIEVRFISEDELRQGSFVRCDPSGDGTLTLTDPIFIANHLFLGGPEAACADTQDCNGDLFLNLTDVIYGLTYLFDQGSRPPAPFPGCGRAEQALGDESCRAGTTPCR